MYIYCPIWITRLLSIVMAVVWTSYGNDNWSSGSVLANCLPYVMANCMSQIIHQTMGQSIPFAWQNVLFQISVWYLHCFYLIWIFQKRIDFHHDIYPTYMYVCIMFQSDKTAGTQVSWICLNHSTVSGYRWSDIWIGHFSNSVLYPGLPLGFPKLPISKTITDKITTQ